MQKLTPAMQQYMDIKKQYPDCILFFRLGDFYEVFREDAQLCSKLLDLVLTAKNKTSEQPIPMAGMPYHSIDKYIAKLIKAGYKIAIADQMSEPKPGQIVQRAVTSIITPGTYIDEKQVSANYILSITTQLCSPLGGGMPTKEAGGSISKEKEKPDSTITYHLSRGDFIAGQYWTTTVDSMSEVHQLVTSLAPKEIILHKTSPQITTVAESLKTQPNTVIAYRDMLDEAEYFALSILRVQSLASFGKALSDGRVAPFALLLSYLMTTQQSTITTIYRVSYYHSNDYVVLDEVTIKNLELFASSYDQDQTYSLFGTLDQCQSTSGSKLLRHILAHPSKNIALIQERQNHIADRVHRREDATSMSRLIGSLYDIPRLLTTLIYKQPQYQSFVRLRTTLETIISSGEGNGCQKELLVIDPEVPMADLISLCNLLQTAIKATEDLAPNAEEYINDNYDPQIDELRHLVHHTDQILLAYHQQLINHTQINELKIVFVTNQGYMIEVTPKHIATLEATRVQGDEYFDLERRQTLKTGQRYSTPYLDDLQHKLLSAKDKLAKQELAVLRQLQEVVIGHYHGLAQMADALAHLDVYTSHALLVRNHRFVKPEITRDSGIHIIAGRHPVIEAHLPVTDSFIPNDLSIDSAIHIITGPNMGGKSTFLRQHALIVLLAHCGLCVPASEAKIGLVDGIFARVGSGDVIAKNQSTFMTEMIEVANIINNATEHSFVIFDELGRGTSTYDGLSITRAIIEHFATTIRCKVLLATHYHELIALADTFDNIHNYHVGVYEGDHDVIFLKKVLPGGMERSYGLEVAKLAGIAKPILEKAKGYLDGYSAPSVPLLDRMGDDHKMRNDERLFSPLPVGIDPGTGRGVGGEAIMQKIKTLIETTDVNYLTPVQAMQLVIKMMELVKG